MYSSVAETSIFVVGFEDEFAPAVNNKIQNLSNWNNVRNFIRPVVSYLGKNCIKQQLVFLVGKLEAEPTPKLPTVQALVLGDMALEQIDM